MMEIKTKEQYIKYIRRTSTIPHGMDGPTPIKLIEEMVDKLPVDWSNPNLKILDPCFGFGGYLFFVYLKLIKFHTEEHILNNMLYGVEIEDFRFELVKHKLKIKNLIKGDFLNTEIFKDMNMKFDVILANYPYEKSVGPSKTEPIWHLFAKKVFNLLNEDAYLSVIHPSSWRISQGKFTFLKDVYFGKKVVSLDLNDFNKGREVFGAGTNFDVITLINSPYELGFKTKIIDDRNIEHFMDLGQVSFLPNSNFDKILSLVAKENEETVEVIYSSSDYEIRYPHMNKEKTDEFKYPCVYTITKKDGINFWYSNTNKNGIFGIPKVIWTNGLGTYPIVDKIGEYGLTQFAYAISDSVDNLEYIKRVMESEEFLDLMKSIKFTNNVYDYKIISTFRKDFWKEFI